MTIAEKFDETYSIKKETLKNFFRVLDLSRDTDKKLLLSSFLHIPFIDIDTSEIPIYGTKSSIQEFWKENLDEYVSSLSKVSGIPRNKCRNFLNIFINSFIVFPDLSINVIVQKVQEKAERENKLYVDAYLALIGE